MLPIYLCILTLLPSRLASVWTKNRKNVDANWRSLCHSTLLVGMLIFGAPFESLLNVMQIFMWMDLSFGEWSWINILHHGSCIGLTGLPLVDPFYFSLFSSVGRPFMWAELSTVFMNGYYLSQKGSRMSTVHLILFLLSFIACRCVYLPYYFYSVDKTSLGMVPYSLLLLLLGLQFWWLGLILKKILRKTIFKK